MTKDKPKILISAEWDGLGEFLSDFLEDQDFKVTVVDPHCDSKKILSALSSGSYGIAVLTDNNLNQDELPDLVSEIKMKHPKVYCLALVGNDKPDFAMKLEKLAIDDFMPMPLETGYFLSRIEEAMQVLARR